MGGKVYRDKGDRWFIWLPGNIRIFVDKQHRNFYSRRDAERCLSQIQGEIENGTFDRDFYSKHRKSILSFISYAEQWLSNCDLRKHRGELAAGYVCRLRGYLTNHWLPFFGERNITELRGKDITRFYLQLGSSPKTRVNIMGALHVLFAAAFDEEVIATMPKFPRMETVPKRFPPWATREQQDVIFNHITDPMARYIISFCIAHGVRIGEARALQHQDIDLERMVVTIQRAFSGANLRPFPKGKQSRALPLDPVWAAAYADRPRALPNSFVFTGNGGHPLGQNFAYRAWVAACRKAGFTCTLHQGTRHSKASQLANAGVPLRFIQQLLGHQQIQTTEKYTHYFEDVEILRQAIQGNVVEMKKKIK